MSNPVNWRSCPQGAPTESGIAKEELAGGDWELMGTCAVCGEEVGAGFRFCGQCGAPLESLSCPECGSANPPDHRFCGRCGGPLAGARTAAPPTSERKLATVLFADVVGFTSLAEHHDPENLA